MAKKLEYITDMTQGATIEGWHVSQSVEAFSPTAGVQQDYDISVSGSFKVTGSQLIEPSKLLSISKNHILSYDGTTGQIFKMPRPVTNVTATTDIAAFTAAVVNGATTPVVSLDLNGGTVGQFLKQDGTWATVPGGNSGTITSVTAGEGMTQTGTGTINPTLNVIATANGGITVVTDSLGVDTTVVRTTGDQTIGGEKTFTAKVVSDSTFTGTNFILSSDIRLKENIEKLKPDTIDVDWKSFTMKDSDEGYRVGVIAQELELDHPEFVETSNEGYKSVKYIDLLITKIAELEARLAKAGI